MKVKDLGEFGLIGLLAEIVDREKDSRQPSWRRLLIGIGDDAAVWHKGSAVQLATTDSLIEGVHFTPDITTWKDLGWKALAVNLSDIAAMGGVPEYALVSLALPGDTEVASVSDLYCGMVELAREFGVAIVGGNISAADRVMITITVLGSAETDVLLRRSSAMPGEKVAVTGYPGLSAGGLKMLRQKLDFPPDEHRLLCRAHLRPVPRVKEAQVLLHSGVSTAIDISDGLIADLSHICKASGVSAVVREELLPVHPVLKRRFPREWRKMVLGGGEDYELLFTASSELIARLKRELLCPVTEIGEIGSGKVGEVKLLDEQGKSRTWRRGGWEHFRYES